MSSGYSGFYCAECWDTERLRSIAKIDVYSRSEINIVQYIILYCILYIYDKCTVNQFGVNFKNSFPDLPTLILPLDPIEIVFYLIGIDNN